MFSGLREEECLVVSLYLASKFKNTGSSPSSLRSSCSHSCGPSDRTRRLVGNIS